MNKLLLLKKIADHDFLPIGVKATMALRWMIEAQDSSVFPLLPEEVKERINGWIETFKSGQPILLASNSGIEDYTGEVGEYISLKGRG